MYQIECTINGQQRDPGEMLRDNATLAEAEESREQWLADLTDSEREYATCIIVECSDGTLIDAATHEPIRSATAAERLASGAATDGIIPVDWRSDGGWNGEDYRLCYVD